MALSASDVNTFITKCQTIDQDFARQLAFILFTECTVEDACKFCWHDIDPEKWIMRLGKQKYLVMGPVREILFSQPRDFNPYVFKYRYPSQLSQKLRTVTKSLGIRPMLTLEELRKGYK